jgi:hypothetical protein
MHLEQCHLSHATARTKLEGQTQPNTCKGMVRGKLPRLTTWHDEKINQPCNMTDMKLAWSSKFLDQLMHQTTLQGPEPVAALVVLLLLPHLKEQGQNKTSMTQGIQHPMHSP